MRVKRREREGGRDQSRGLGLCFLNLCVGGEASPTQNALRHSSQPTQVSRCIFSLQTSLFISYLQRFSESLETAAECSRMLRARCQPLICATSRLRQLKGYSSPKNSYFTHFATFTSFSTHAKIAFSGH